MAQHRDQSTCTDAVRTHDRDRWLAAALAPAAARRRLLVLCALNLELARIPELTTEPMVGRIRLQWWRESLAEAGAGRVRDHPVLRAIARLLEAGHLSAADLEDFLDAREADFEETGPKDMAAFTATCRGTGGGLWRMAVKALGVAEPDTMAAAEAVGGAHAMVGQLRNTAWYAGRGRVVLPLDLLATHGVPTDRLLAGAPGDGLATAAREIAQSAGRELARARAKRNGIPRAALPALVLARITECRLRHLAARGFDLFSADTEPLPLALPLAVLRGAVTGRY
ncbi:MAG: squalene/phytoene synthase family protein [Alphaproteobacteria bacterium]